MHLTQIIDSLKRAMLLPMINDAGRQVRAHTGKLAECTGISSVQINSSRCLAEWRWWLQQLPRRLHRQDRTNTKDESKCQFPGSRPGNES